MRPALQRRRRQLLTRRIQNRSKRQGLASLLVAFILVIGLMVGGSALGTAGGMLATYNYFASDLPDPVQILDLEMPESTYVYDRTGTRLLTRFECENREEVTFNDLPEHVVNATIAAEDRTFWVNDGIDYAAVARAALANLEAGQIVQGASTITQQVIKYAGSIQEAGQPEQLDPDAAPAPDADIDPDEDAATTEEEEEALQRDICEPPELTFLEGRGYGDKIREQILARQVTEAHPGREGKEMILATYLNLIFYGNGSYGIQSAAANYFGISDLEELTLAQAAFLAGLPQRPSAYDPYFQDQGPALAIERRNLVLRAMLEEGYITSREYIEASNTTWEEMNPSRTTSPLPEPHFTFRVQREAEQILESLGVENPQLGVRIGGYRIVTTLDYDLQQMAKEEVSRWVAELVDKNVHNGALVAMDSNTGEIVAYVGSVDYYNREDPRVQGQFDVAGLGLRQSGSAMKPITYATAFQRREATVATFLMDTLTEFVAEGDESYRPRNADRTEHGPMLAVDALRYSLNIPSVQMQYIAGVTETAQVAEEMGLASADYILGLDPNLTLTLGTVPTRLVNMTAAYGAFAQEGVVRPGRTISEIRDRYGRLVYSLANDGPEPRQALEPEVAYLTHWILESNTDPERNIFWGTRAQIDDPDGVRRQAGFKTGTTDDFRDVSGYGYLPGGLVTGVWMGNNNMEPLVSTFGEGLFAADGPLFLWRSFMERAVNEPWEWNGHQPVPQTTFAPPPGIATATVCRWSGMAATGNCSPTLDLPFIEGTQPPADTAMTRGCLDVIGLLEREDRPDNWIEAAETFIERVQRGEREPSGDHENWRDDPDIRYQINPLYGEPSLPSLCSG